MWPNCTAASAAYLLDITARIAWIDKMNHFQLVEIATMLSNLKLYNLNM